MTLILLSIHLVVCIALIGLVLLQRSEGGALGIGGSGGSLMSGRGAADALSKMTMFAGAFFMATSMGLTLITKFDTGDGRGVLDIVPSISAPATTTAPATEAPAETPATTPDPTQSSAPEAATSQLAAAEQLPATARTVSLGPASASASERAGPLTATTTPQRAPATRPAAPGQVQTASTQQPASTRPQPTTRQSAAQPATTQPATRQAATAGGPITTQRQPATTTPALLLPGAAQATAALQQPQGAVVSPESSEGEAGLAAVRRERAGPDQ